MKGSHVLWNLGSHREERRGEACCVLSKACSSARVPMVRGHVYSARSERVYSRLERCAEIRACVLVSECVCVHDVTCVAQCLKLLLIKKPPLTGTALHHTRCALALCGAECAPAPGWRAGGVRVAVGTCRAPAARESRPPVRRGRVGRVEGGLVGIWGLGLLQQNEPIPHTLHSTLTLYTRRRQYQRPPRRARP